MQSTDPGLIVAIDADVMRVKVPVGRGCGVCLNKTSCTFSGPERSYRTFQVRREEGCHVGDRVLVHVPGSVLGLSGLVFSILPFVLILVGYKLLDCCFGFPYATVVLWAAGVIVWLGAMYGANAWMERSVRFHERITPIADLLREPGEIGRRAMEDDK